MICVILVRDGWLILLGYIPTPLFTLGLSFPIVAPIDPKLKKPAEDPIGNQLPGNRSYRRLNGKQETLS